LRRRRARRRDQRLPGRVRDEMEMKIAAAHVPRFPASGLPETLPLNAGTRMWTDVDNRPGIAASHFFRVDALPASPIDRLGIETRL
jgi:hypothetical protein